MVVLLVWFSLPERNTVICLLERSPWLQGGEWTVAARRGSREPARRPAVRREKTVVRTGVAALEEVRSVRILDTFWRNEVCCGFYRVPQTYMSMC